MNARAILLQMALLLLKRSSVLAVIVALGLLLLLLVRAWFRRGRDDKGRRTDPLARTHARVHCSIWNDLDFVALSSTDQRTFLMLLSQPDMSLCGALAYRPKRWARLGPQDTVRAVEASIRRLELAEYVVVDHETDELWVRSFIRWDGILRANPNMRKAMWDAIRQVMSDAIREGFDKVFSECESEGLVKAHGVVEGVGEGKGAGAAKPLTQACPTHGGILGFDCECPPLSAVPDEAREA